jgi:parallel beta-helix repeat protein
MTSASAPCPDPGPAPPPRHRRHRRHLLIGAAGLAVCLAGVAAVVSGDLRVDRRDDAAPPPVAGPPSAGDTVRLAGASAVRRAVEGRVLRVVAKAPKLPAGTRPSPPTGTETAPFLDVQTAIYAAQPGDTVLLAPGTFTGEFETVRSGRPGAPITIAGEAGATLRGRGISEGRVLTVENDWIVVSGLRITRGDKGIWVQEATNVTLRDNTVRDTGGECIRVKYLAVRNEIAGNRIGPCGAVNFNLKASRKNGEGVYIGTAPEQLSRNPTTVSDASNQNWVHDNVITTRAECVDLKEGASLNVVERNTCSGGQDPDGSGLDSRGNDNVFRFNTVTDVLGKGVRLGGDTPSQGVGNEVVGNTLLRTGGHAVGAMRLPQKRICGNTVGSNRDGASNVKSLLPSSPCP